MPSAPISAGASAANCSPSWLMRSSPAMSPAAQKPINAVGGRETRAKKARLAAVDSDSSLLAHDTRCAVGPGR